MYNSQITADRIKELSKERGIQMIVLQEKCQLSPNTIKQSGKSEFGLKAKNLYNIANELDCSVDYLLGRTDVKEINTNVHKKSAIDREYEIDIEDLKRLMHEKTKLHIPNTDSVNVVVTVGNSNIKKSRTLVSGVKRKPKLQTSLDSELLALIRGMSDTDKAKAIGVLKSLKGELVGV